MTDVARQTSRVSKMTAQVQTAQGTQATLAGEIDTATFDVTLDPKWDFYEELAGQLDSEVEAMPGIPKVNATLTTPLKCVQGVQLIKSTIGGDSWSGASSTSFGTVVNASLPVGSTSITLSGAAPAAPTNVADWTMAPLTITDGTNGNEDVFILDITGTTVTCSPTRIAHATGLALSVAAKVHCFQPRTGTSAAVQDFVSIWALFGTLLERDAMDALVTDWSLKTTNAQRIDQTLKFDVCAPLVYDSVAQAGTISGITYATGEAADLPFRLTHGYFYSYGKAADTIMVPHKRLQDFQYQLTVGMDTVYEGGPATVEQSYPMKRTQQITIKDSAGEGAFTSMATDFANGTGRFMKAAFGLIHPNTGATFSMYFPKCACSKYDPAQADGKVVSRDGMIHPILDRSGTGIALRVWVKNAVLTNYGA